jgi:chemotaxis protein methyltransferase CheR
VSSSAIKSRTPAPIEGAVAEPSDRDFGSFRALILERAGIFLNDSKKALLYGRLARRVRELGLASFGDYYARARDDEAELTQMLDRITTNETHFFREPHHFEFLARARIPEIVAAGESGERARHVSVWSAGCSTGEEPYSIAMTLLDGLPQTGWSVNVLATDLSTRALDVARRATWPIARAPEIGDAHLKRYMLRGVGSQSGFIRASTELRALVHVDRLNLSTDEYPEQTFDFIFCRNVLIYFHPVPRQRVLARLVERLAPGGLLFVGHAESVQGLSGMVRCVSPTIYARNSDAAPSGRRRGA